MQKIKWDKNFEFGFEEIDKQHKFLIGLLNEFIDARNEGKDFQILKEILSRLLDYTKYHFATEEKFLEENNYPRIAEHRRLHKELIDETTKISNDFNSNNIEISDDIFNLLIHWVLSHILEKDMDYKNFVKK